MKQALLQDPKKTSVMGALFLILAIVAGRALLSGGAVRPALAAGNGVTAANPPAIVPPARVTSGSLRPDNSLRDWIAAKVPPVDRNDFQVKAECFPIDTSKAVVGISDDTFWTQLKKSLVHQSDQRINRQNQIDAIKAQADAIRPQSTMMGAHPRAMVNGTLLAEGDMVAGFRLLKVESRGIIVEREGVRFEIPMR